MEIRFDDQRIDDMEYVAQQIREADWNKDPQTTFDWLNPIRKRLIPESNISNAENE